MKDSNRTPTASPRAVAAGDHPAWLLGLLLLLAWQGWQAVGLFGPERALERLLDDDPVVSGRHPLHLYHGYLGARALSDRGCPSCYDPAFQAGYPKTPVFDPGSRPAEVALALAWARYSPAAYKVALVVFCLVAPLCLYAAGRGAGLVRAQALAACLLGLLVWWGRPGRDALEAGDVDLLLAAVMLLAQLGLLVRYHERPGVIGLAGVVLSGLVGWFAHPFLSVLMAPVFLVYYLNVGPRHRPAWHAPLLAGLALAVAANAFWLHDWVSYWWIRVPPCRETPLLDRRTLLALWESPRWGGCADKVFACVVLGLGLAGLALLYRSGRRIAARLLALAGAGLMALGLAGTSWEPFARLGACQLLAPGLLFVTLPASVALLDGLGWLRRWSGTAWTPLVLLAALPVLATLAAPEQARAWGEALIRPRPFEIGLGDEREALVEAVRRRTTGEARVLWEDRRGAREQSRWTALLPVLTDRAFVGGLDADAGIEHATTGLVDGSLAGRRLAEWSDAELEEYCRRYNIGWVVCWTQEARDRLARWPGAGKAQGLPGGGAGAGWLVPLSRRPSYALAGSVRWGQADSRGILLADAVPQRVGDEPEGQVVLSLHYQAGMRVRPGRVRLEQAVDTQDTIPFVRLRMREPVGRILITWEGR